GRATGIIIFDGELKASQHYQLEEAIGTRCMDRIDLILELFATRARTKESKLQVELARIERELPLLRERISKRKVEECPGFLAGGGYGVNTYYHRTRQGKKRIP
ncbi:MAG: GTPase HflX, partial [Thermoplasmata archaeon]